MPSKKTTLYWALVGALFVTIGSLRLFYDPAHNALIEVLFYSGTWQAIKSVGYFTLYGLIAALVTGLIPWAYWGLKWCVRRLFVVITPK